MEKYKITVIGAKAYRKSLQKDECECGEDYAKEIGFLLSIENGFEVETIQEYFDMLDKFYEILETEFEICNCGRLIAVSMD